MGCCLEMGSFQRFGEEDCALLAHQADCSCDEAQPFPENCHARVDLLGKYVVSSSCLSCGLAGSSGSLTNIILPTIIIDNPPLKLKTSGKKNHLNFLEDVVS